MSNTAHESAKENAYLVSKRSTSHPQPRNSIEELYLDDSQSFVSSRCRNSEVTTPSAASAQDHDDSHYNNRDNTRRRTTRATRTSEPRSPNERPAPRSTFSSSLSSTSESQRFLPSLGRILEGRASDYAVSKHSSDSVSKKQKHPPTQGSSRRRRSSAPLQARTFQKQLLQDRVRRLTSPSLQSVASGITTNTSSSSGSNSTVTPSSHSSFTEGRSRRFSAGMNKRSTSRTRSSSRNDMTRHLDRSKAKSQRNQPDVFDYLEEVPRDVAQEGEWSSTHTSSEEDDEDRMDRGQCHVRESAASFRQRDDWPVSQTRDSSASPALERTTPVRPTSWPNVTSTPQEQLHSDSGISVRSSSPDSISKSSGKGQLQPYVEDAPSDDQSGDSNHGMAQAMPGPRDIEPRFSHPSPFQEAVQNQSDYAYYHASTPSPYAQSPTSAPASWSRQVVEPSPAAHHAPSLLRHTFQGQSPYPPSVPPPAPTPPNYYVRPHIFDEAPRQRRKSKQPLSRAPNSHGYSLLANALSTNESKDAGDYSSPDTVASPPPLYRRFSFLNHRILLHLQDELSELESKLESIDSAIAEQSSSWHFEEADVDPSSGDGEAGPEAKNSPRKEGGSRHHRRASHSTTAGWESRRQDSKCPPGSLQYQRRELLGMIFGKVGQYNSALKSYQTLLTSTNPIEPPNPATHPPPASTTTSTTTSSSHANANTNPDLPDPIHTYRTFLAQHNNPLSTPETAFLSHPDDLIHLTPSPKPTTTTTTSCSRCHHHTHPSTAGTESQPHLITHTPHYTRALAAATVLTSAMLGAMFSACAGACFSPVGLCVAVVGVWVLVGRRVKKGVEDAVGWARVRANGWGWGSGWEARESGGESGSARDLDRDCADDGGKIDEGVSGRVEDEKRAYVRASGRYSGKEDADVLATNVDEDEDGNEYTRGGGDGHSYIDDVHASDVDASDDDDDDEDEGGSSVDDDDHDDDDDGDSD
ncbi:MAG: hypothetical protein M1831_007379 [Alyxoria varia]|nr:MAG: hypothetical protein M1831_007379 [Alyxoria varia]